MTTTLTEMTQAAAVATFLRANYGLASIEQAAEAIRVYASVAGMHDSVATVLITAEVKVIVRAVSHDAIDKFREQMRNLIR